MNALRFGCERSDDSASGPQRCDLGLDQLPKLHVSRTFAAPLREPGLKYGLQRVELPARRHYQLAIGIGLEITHRLNVVGIVGFDKARRRSFAAEFADRVLA